jgi:hypothetical protein
MGVGLMHHLLADSRHQARAPSSPTVACHVCLLSSFLYSEKKKEERKINTWAFFTLPFSTKGKMRMMRCYIFNEHMIAYLHFGPSMDYRDGALDYMYA